MAAVGGKREELLLALALALLLALALALVLALALALTLRWRGRAPQQLGGSLGGVLEGLAGAAD